MTEVTQPIEPTLIYSQLKTVYLNIPTWEGLPPWISQDAKRAIFRSLTNAIATNILQWTRPVLVATQLKMNLATQHEKVQTVFLRAMPRYQGIKILIHIINQTINQINNQISNQISNQILRAMPRYQGIVAHDCVKVWIDEENNEGATIKECILGNAWCFCKTRRANNSWSSNGSTGMRLTALTRFRNYLHLNWHLKHTRSHSAPCLSRPL